MNYTIVQCLQESHIWIFEITPDLSQRIFISNLL